MASPVSPPPVCLQLLALSGLQRLHLKVASTIELVPASCTALGRLTSLRWLGLAGFGNVPRELLAGLAELRQLQALHLDRLVTLDMEWGPWYFTHELRDHQEQQEAQATAAAAAATMAQLTALTELVLHAVGALLPPPASLAQLSRLQRLEAWYEQSMLPAEGPESLAHPLASGPWQRSMRSLSADWSLVQRSGAAFLAGLAQLEELYVHQAGVWVDEWDRACPGNICQCNWFWEWVEGHAPPQHVSLEVDTELVLLEELQREATDAADADVAAAQLQLHPPELGLVRPRLARLAERRPQLKVDCDRADTEFC